MKEKYLIKIVKTLKKIEEVKNLVGYYDLNNLIDCYEYLKYSYYELKINNYLNPTYIDYKIEIVNNILKRNEELK